MITILKKTRGKQDAKTRDEGSYIPLLVKKVLLLHTFYLQKMLPLSHYTVLLKSKLTVTLVSIFETQDLILDS